MKTIDRGKSENLQGIYFLISSAFQALILIGDEVVKTNPVQGYILFVIGVSGAIYFFGKLTYEVIKCYFLK